MNIALDYTITAREFFQFVPPATNTRWSLAYRGIDRVAYVAAIAFLSAAAWRAVAAGIDSSFWSSISMAAVFGASIVFPMILRAVMLFALRNSSVHVSIDHDRVIVRAKRSVQTIPWSSFALTGSAAESSDHLLLKCGRGSVPIPKRVFPDPHDAEVFRTMVTSLSNGRCVFPSAATLPIS